jgi:hypothetical protein
MKYAVNSKILEDLNVEEVKLLERRIGNYVDVSPFFSGYLDETGEVIITKYQEPHMKKKGRFIEKRINVRDLIIRIKQYSTIPVDQGKELPIPMYSTTKKS